MDYKKGLQLVEAFLSRGKNNSVQLILSVLYPNFTLSNLFTISVNFS